MNLVQLQRAVARAVMQPLTRKEGMRAVGPRGENMRRYAARYIRPNDRLSSFERLEIYNRQYWFRVLGSMVEDFPGLQAVVGERRFEAMCRAYLTDCPSRSFTLRNLGSRLEAWLLRNQQWIRGVERLALDMVRLEWADIAAFDGGAEPVLHASELGETAAWELRLQLQPYVQLLALHYPVDDLVLDVRDNNRNAGVASNAVGERRKRAKVRSVKSRKLQEIFLVVHRQDLSVYFRRIDREAYVMLSGLRAGKSIGVVVEKAFTGSSIPEVERTTYVQRSFATWAALGWFCKPGGANPSKGVKNNYEDAFR